MMMPKIIVVAPTTAVADEHRFGRGLEGVARAVALFEFELWSFQSRGLNPKSFSISARTFGTDSMRLNS